MCPDLERGCKVEPLESLNDLERLVRLMADSKLGHSAARLVSPSHITVTRRPKQLSYLPYSARRTLLT